MTPDRGSPREPDASEQWLRDEAGVMDTSGIAANPHDLAAELRGVADDYAALLDRAEKAERERDSMKRLCDNNNALMNGWICAHDHAHARIGELEEAERERDEARRETAVARAQLTEARNAVLREGLEVERLRPVVEAAVAWHEAGCDLYAAVDTFNAARKDT